MRAVLLAVCLPLCLQPRAVLAADGRGEPPRTAPKEVPAVRSTDLTLEAAAALKGRGYDEAVRLLDQAIGLDPENGQAYQLRATARIHQSRFEEAVEDSTKALMYSSVGVAPLNSRALAYNRLGRHEEALLDAAEALMSNPRSALAHYNRAFARAGLGQRKESLTELKRAALLDSIFKGRLAEASAAADDEGFLAVFSRPADPEGAGGGSVLWPLLAVLAVGAGMLLAAGRRRGSGRPRAAGRAGGLCGRYDVVRGLPAGTSGPLFEAFDRELRRRVAVRRLRPEIALDARERARFLAVAREAERLRHPALVELFSVEERGEEVYLVFEYAEGGTLRDLVAQQGRLSLPQAQDVFRGVCEGLQYAHGAGMPHRDLKPTSILPEVLGSIRLVGLGVSREAKDALARLSPAEGPRVPPHLPPECEEGRMGPEADVYSLGVCLYLALTGRPPFEGSPADELLNKRSGTFPKASGLAGGLGAGVDALFGKALDPRPDRRFHSPREFFESLNLAAAGRIPT